MPDWMALAIMVLVVIGVFASIEGFVKLSTLSLRKKFKGAKTLDEKIAVTKKHCAKWGINFADIDNPQLTQECRDLERQCQEAKEELERFKNR